MYIQYVFINYEEIRSTFPSPRREKSQNWYLVWLINYWESFHLSYIFILLLDNSCDINKPFKSVITKNPIDPIDPSQNQNQEGSGTSRFRIVGRPGRLFGSSCKVQGCLRPNQTSNLLRRLFLLWWASLPRWHDPKQNRVPHHSDRSWRSCTGQKRRVKNDEATNLFYLIK